MTLHGWPNPPHLSLHELHKPKASKGEGVLGGEGQAQGDRGGHTQRDTERHRERERERERERDRHKDTDRQRGKGREEKRTLPEKKIAQINWRAMMSIAKLLGHNWLWNMATHVWHVKDIIDLF